MRRVCYLAAVIFCMLDVAAGHPTSLDPSSFRTNAKFSVDNASLTLSSAVATIEPRPNASGYSWLRITFYSFPLTAEDVAGVAKGDAESLERKWNRTANDPKKYNTSHAVIQLTVDKAFKVWQVDMSVPGRACTIAPWEQDVRNFLQEYQFDGAKLRLKSQGSYICEMKSVGIPDQKFGWQIDVNIPVFESVNSKKPR